MMRSGRSPIQRLLLLTAVLLLVLTAAACRPTTGADAAADARATRWTQPATADSTAPRRFRYAVSSSSDDVDLRQLWLTTSAADLTVGSSGRGLLSVNGSFVETAPVMEWSASGDLDLVGEPGSPEVSFAGGDGSGGIPTQAELGSRTSWLAYVAAEGTRSALLDLRYVRLPGLDYHSMSGRNHVRLSEYTLGAADQSQVTISLKPGATLTLELPSTIDLSIAGSQHWSEAPQGARYVEATPDNEVSEWKVDSPGRAGASIEIRVVSPRGDDEYIAVGDEVDLDDYDIRFVD